MRRALVPFLLLVAVLAALATACGSTAEPTAEAVDDRAPAADFEAPALEGGDEISLSELRGTPVVLNFWASWCPPCRAEMPTLDAFAEDNPDIKVVGLAVSDRVEDSRAFAEGIGIDFPLGVDRDGTVSLKYGATGLPVTVVIDADGNVARTWFGEIGRDDLDQLAGQVRA